ncbi:ATP-binding protein [Streptomyces sp. NPDC005989]|uniref:ATP-binding protein n=1 Tax=Streptomyces sp. NPDC005989 TaxID=3156727 RepID=UPI0033BFC41B
MTHTTSTLSLPRPRTQTPASAVAATSGAALDKAIALTRKLKLSRIRRALTEIAPVAKAQPGASLLHLPLRERKIALLRSPRTSRRRCRNDRHLVHHRDLGALVRRHRVFDSVTKAVARITRTDLITVDDIGLLPISPDATEGFYRLVDAAYERRNLAVSSNLHPAGFDEITPKTLKMLSTWGSLTSTSGEASCPPARRSNCPLRPALTPHFVADSRSVIMSA